MENQKRGINDVKNSVYDLLNRLKQLTQGKKDLTNLEKTEFELLKLVSLYMKDSEVIQTRDITISDLERKFNSKQEKNLNSIKESI